MNIEKDLTAKIKADAFQGLSRYNGATVKFTGDKGVSGKTYAAAFVRGLSGIVYLMPDQVEPVK